MLIMRQSTELQGKGTSPGKDYTAPQCSLAERVSCSRSNPSKMKEIVFSGRSLTCSRSMTKVLSWKTKQQYNES